MISVIVPVYKVEKYINRCIESILSQTYTDFELILVDDGSPDSCPEIIDEYAKVDRRIKAIHQKNGGLSAARNTGIDYVIHSSNSEWITFIDSDDWVDPRYLEKLLEACVKNDVMISLCEYQKVYEKEEKVILEERENLALSPEELWAYYQGPVDEQQKVYLSATVAWGKLYRKQLWENIRYPVGKLHEDEFTTYKLLFEQNIVAVVQDNLLFYFQNDAGIILSKWNLKRLDVIDAYDQQKVYFKRKGFVKAYYFAKISQYDAILDSLEQLKKHHYSKEYHVLKERYKKILNDEYKINKPFSNYEIYYLAAFPVKAKIIIYKRSLLDRVKHMLGIEK